MASGPTASGTRFCRDCSFKVLKPGVDWFYRSGSSKPNDSVAFWRQISSGVKIAGYQAQGKCQDSKHCWQDSSSCFEQYHCWVCRCCHFLEPHRSIIVYIPYFLFKISDPIRDLCSEVLNTKDDRALHGKSLRVAWGLWYIYSMEVLRLRQVNRQCLVQPSQTRSI